MSIRILIADSMSPRAVDIFKSQNDFVVDVKTGLPEDELVRIIGQYEAMVVRSATKVTARIIDAGSRLRIIGRAGSGVDNIDLKAATRKGIVVMNTPGANTVSTAERASGVPSFALVCPSNCGSFNFTAITAVSPSCTSSPVSESFSFKYPFLRA